MENFREYQDGRQFNKPAYAGFETEKLEGYPFFKTVESFRRYIGLNDKLDAKLNNLFKKIIENEGVLSEDIINEFRKLYNEFDYVNNFWLFLGRDEREREKETKKRGRKKDVKMTEEERAKQEELEKLEKEFRAKHVETAAKFWAILEKIALSENKKFSKYELKTLGYDLSEF